MTVKLTGSDLIVGKEFDRLWPRCTDSDIETNITSMTSIK